VETKGNGGVAEIRRSCNTTMHTLILKGVGIMWERSKMNWVKYGTWQRG
jgi:hypothetical protein